MVTEYKSAVADFFTKIDEGWLFIPSTHELFQKAEIKLPRLFSRVFYLFFHNETIILLSSSFFKPF